MGFLQGRRALVTGASRNLGAEIARHLAAEGASVAVNYRSSEDDALQVVESLECGPDSRHSAVQGDVSLASDISRLVETTSSELGGPIDVLINNAGPYLSTPFVEMDVDDFDRVWDANARAVYLLARAVAPGMRAAGFGRIVNISASSAFVRNRSIYTLANSAVITLTEQLALELAPEVMVNAVAPGQIYESLDELREFGGDWADEVIRRTPLGRLATRSDIAHLVTLMCGPAFDVITGVNVPIDGGLRLRTI